MSNINTPARRLLKNGVIVDVNDVVVTTDPRLSDARTPTAHTHPLSDLTQSGASTNDVATWNGSAWVPQAPGGGGGGGSVPTGTGFRHVTAGVEDSAAQLVTNADVGAGAAIVESKLSLNFATHSNANDPSSGEKAALAGTNGTPGGGNKFVTDSDPRNTNSRTPTAHSHVSSEVTDFSEAVDDRVAALLVAGSNITLTYNDGSNTLTVAAAAGSVAITSATISVPYGTGDALVSVTDAGVSPSSVIMLSYGSYLQTDENDPSDAVLSVEERLTGSFNVRVRANGKESVGGLFKINYIKA